MLYPMVMARKEVLVQLDDELVRRLDALAARLGTSRSELVRIAGNFTGPVPFAVAAKLNSALVTASGERGQRSAPP